MIVFPAVDLYGGRVVRLLRGDYSKMRGYAVDPVEAAKGFRDAGCLQIHIVDLEGAKAGEPKHLDALEKIAALGLFVQYGGGLRSADAVARALNSGASRVMAGSLIFKDMRRAPELAARFGGKIMAAVDVKEGKERAERARGGGAPFLRGLFVVPDNADRARRNDGRHGRRFLPSLYC